MGTCDDLGERKYFRKFEIPASLTWNFKMVVNTTCQKEKHNGRLCKPTFLLKMFMTYEFSNISLHTKMNRWFVQIKINHSIWIYILNVALTILGLSVLQPGIFGLIAFHWFSRFLLNKLIHFTQTPLNRSQQLPALYKRLIQLLTESSKTTRERLDNWQFD